VRHATIYSLSPIHKPNRPDQRKWVVPCQVRYFLCLEDCEAIYHANLTSLVEENFTQRKVSYAFEKGCEVSGSVHQVMSRIASESPSRVRHCFSMKNSMSRECREAYNT
jgi:hypothetical protein